MKKMKTGGTRKRYQDGGPTLEDLEKQTRREFLKGKSAKIGLGTVGAGITSIIGKKISDVVKKKREGNKEVKGLVKNLVKKAKSTRVMQKGGATLPMMGMPMYSNNPRSEQGRILKAGGSTTNRAVAPGCRGGMVKDASGKCVAERKFKKGGFPDLNKDGKVTRADILKGRGVIKKTGGITKMDDGGATTKKNFITGRTRVTTPYAVGAPSKGTVAPRDYATGTKTEVYSKKGDLVKTKYKSRGTGKYDTGNSRYPYNYVREEEKPGGEKKEKYPILPSYMQPADKLKKAGGATTSKTLKPVPAGKPGLAKLPTPVRNKMGFQKKGGPVKKK
jgi:hypothetical protein